MKIKIKPINPNIISKIENEVTINSISNLSDTDFDYLEASKKNFVKTVLPIIIKENQNIIVTRKSEYIANGCIVANSLEKAIEIAKKNGDKEPFVIGGGQIYKLALERDLIDRVYLTRIHHYFDGDTYFPELSSDWIEISRQDFKADEKNKYDYSFLILEKQ